VIFLCGVMVGRGVPERTLANGTGTETQVDPTASIPPPAAAVGTSDRDYIYPELLENPNPPDESLAPAAETAVATLPARAPAAAPAPARAPATPALKPPSPASPEPSAAPRLAEPAGQGFVVQVAAVRQRSEANRIAQRLTEKGYPAFVTTSGANFRVRVGKFDNRKEADTVAGRLEREEQFKPWITR
jgi:cell division septation protein DedD